ncbi:MULTISPECIES: DUF3108 domain-containing protein [unclassified Devosia]|uniref:DUF3108 domain-containing protein n=1 Tax=unclassified Devosia TaxID=196773 RepID=UPI00145D7A43|nr:MULTISPECIES: DUF3108 domain-containing protein [unclassified Devosia]MBJ6987630.1 DUF3108 domain-containing protein [Devosia sp. MC521]QMW62316.1 DUF3108 domain-containing protein [Devosia sp. MC521]
MIRPAFALLAALIPMTALPISAAPVEAKASYVITVGGINVALLDVKLKDDGARYNLDLAANVTGLGSVVASGTATAQSRGPSNGQRLLSDSFQLETRANGERFNVNVDYANRNVTAFTVEPPVLDSYDRVAVERRHLTGVQDFLSSFVLKGTALDQSLCNQTLPIFTGVERFNIKTGYLKQDEATSPRTGYQGPLVACSLEYQPVSGHFTSSEMTSYLADSSRIIIWYAPLADSGYFIPYRVIVGTSMGDLSMVLTQMQS